MNPSRPRRPGGPLDNYDLVTELPTLVNVGDRQGAADTLCQIAESPHMDQLLNGRFLVEQANFLRGDPNEKASEMFAKADFMGGGGHFLIVAPYTQARGGVEHTALSMLLGRKCSLTDFPDPKAKVKEIFGYDPSFLQTVISVEVYEAAGNTGTDTGEAFMVPASYGFTDADEAPALLDMPLQAKRFNEAGCRAIEKVFEKYTAQRIFDVILNPERSARARHLEYQGHDLGHGIGIGLRPKMRSNGLAIAANRGREEFRADGVSFKLAKDLLTTSQVADMVTSYLATRFALDAHRKGGIELDADVICSRFAYRSMRQTEMLVPTEDGLLITDLSDSGLVQLVGQMAEDAVALTRKELRLVQAGGIANLYACPDITAELDYEFRQSVIKPGSDLYRVLL
jgi:hypothetical protein